MPNEVVFFDSQETGAPTLNNIAGSLIALLDACLINGFALKAVSAITVTGGVASAVSAGHGYATGRMVDLAGATPSAINTRHKITVVDADRFTFPAPAGVADGATITGTITAKRSPLGWVKAHAGTNKAIYARTDVAASASMFRVDDTGAAPAGGTFASIFGVEAAAGVDSYTNATTASTLEKGANDASAKRWVLVGDSRSFYLFTEHPSYTYGSRGVVTACAGFGDVKSFRAGDPWRAFTLANRHALCPRVLTGSASGFSAHFRLQRAAGGLALNVGGALLGHEYQGNGGDADQVPFGRYDPAASPSNTAAYTPRWPSPVDGGFAVQYPIPVIERNDMLAHPVRGVMPGLAAPLAAIGSSLAGPLWFGRVLPGVAGTGRDFLVVSYGAGNFWHGAVLFDITGPWQ